jgi:uncharacterized membrane protein
MLISGSIGIITGGAISFFIFKNFLPQDSWKALGALSGSWMGGSATMMAIAQSIGTPDSLLGPIIVVDTVVGYGWMGIVIFLAVFQERVDKFNNVNRGILIELNSRMENIYRGRRRPISIIDFATMVLVSFGGGVVALEVGKLIPEIGVIVTHYTWGIIIATTFGIIFSFTRLSELEFAGSSHIGNFLLYLLLASVGAKANIAGIFETPIFMIVGIVWILIHAICLFLAGRFTRSPMFLMASASQANIGGTVTAPIVASVYQSALAPVGLLMAVAGNIIGIYGGLLCSQILYFISSS